MTALIVGKKRRSNEMYDEDIKDELCHILSPPLKKCKSTFTLQHLVSIHQSILVCNIETEFSPTLIILLIVPFISNNISCTLQSDYQTFNQFAVYHHINYLDIMNLLKCTFCGCVHGINGFINADKYKCNDCKNIFCDSICYYDEKHIYKCVDCQNGYCKKFNDDNMYCNDILKCKMCDEFICSRCYKYNTNNYCDNVFCDNCYQTIEYNEYIYEQQQTVDTDTRTISQKYDKLQTHYWSNLLNQTNINNESCDAVNYGDYRVNYAKVDRSVMSSFCRWGSRAQGSQNGKIW
eukprot:308281_1